MNPRASVRRLLEQLESLVERATLGEPSFDDYMEQVTALADRLELVHEALPNGGAIFSRHVPGRPYFSILSGLHGEERCGPIFIRDMLAQWQQTGLPDCSLVVIPLLNKYGWDRDARLDRNGKNFNCRWTDDFDDNEVVTRIKRFWKNLPEPIRIHWDIHEDSEIKDSKAYLWAHKSKQGDPIRAMAKVLGVKVTEWSKRGDTASENYVKERFGAPITLTSEVPQDWSLEDRIDFKRKVFELLLPMI